ncbi:MAG: insulinase family protein [Bacteroidales bacterium]|jgi:predicted Zn-dependent peptidase|nr:insulinase family protein [Bacteroidales bacterium]
MKKVVCFVVAFLCIAVLTVNAQNYKYETVPGDPLKSRIYTLENGLKVYMTVYKEEPSIQTMIAVKVGGKNDPKETTGLAHYFEHIMFKGTSHFGTQDYSAEKPLLDRIEAEFEIYRMTTDSLRRIAVYKRIDSLSYEASKLAIPNEYDKLMSAIGSTGTNAYTGYDMTVYVENIPSNQIENWIKVQSDRFTNPVVRGFHTELETVYEEKNMSLTQDSRKVYETLLSSLFQNHPYGTQTVLGTQEDLKNPSITNIKKYFNTYYVASNMAICMSGDFNPDEAIKVIDRYMKSIPKGNAPKLDFKAEPAIATPVTKIVLGNDAENVSIGFRIPGAKSPDSDVLDVMSDLLNNGKAGLIDLNLIQKQRVLSASAYPISMSDYSVFVLSGRPKEGQTLGQVKDLLLEQIELLKKGDLNKELIQATIANYRLNMLYRLQSNYSRANLFVESFINDIPWKDICQKLDRQAKLTPKDITDCANKYFASNYVVIYKEKGKDPNEKKMAKPAITPIVINRDAQSQFLADIINSKVKPIEPVFLDYKKDLVIKELRPQIPLLYTHNKENSIFTVYYRFDMGSNNDKALGTAFNYLKYLGTSKYTPEQIQMEFYKLACSFGVSSGSDYVYVHLDGLSDNMEKALALLEELISDPQVNAPAFTNLVADIKQRRNNAKLNQQTIFSYLRNYAIWGSKSSMTNVPSSAELDRLKPEELTARIKDLANFPHKVMYYGPLSEKQVTALLNKYHKTASTLKPYPPAVKFTQQSTDQNKVLFANYDSKQLYLSMVTKGVSYSNSLYIPCTMYNEYFSGNMNSVVFQEMREARGLAYSAYAYYSQPSKPVFDYIFFSFIATQNDKMDEALTAFLSIINNMPESEKAFTLAKDQVVSNIRKQRIRRTSIMFNYLDAQEFGWDHDKRKDLFDKVQTWTLDDVKKFQQQYVKDKKYTYCVLGDEKDLNREVVDKYGTLQKLTLEEIFGY